MQAKQTNELKEYSEVIRWLNDESLQILNKGYLLKGETPYTAMQRIARAGQRHLIGTPLYEESYDKFMWLMVSGILGISSPIWANMGTQRGLPISCFNVHLTDSILGITNKLGEVITQTKIGGGTSGYFGELRPRGSEIKNNGKSSGAVSFMQLFDTSMNVVSQGSCYVEGTKVLTDSGFKDFRDVVYGKDRLAMLDEKNNVYFTDEYELTVNDFDGELVGIRGIKNDSLIDIKVTPNHRMVINRLTKNKKGKSWKENTEIVLAEDLKLHRDNRMFISGKTSTNGIGLTDEERLMIAYQADGYKSEKYLSQTMRFRFKKERKIKRLTEIVERLGYDYEIKPQTTDESIINFYIYDVKELKQKTLKWVDISVKSYEWCEEFLNEVSLWDGTINHSGKSFSYSSVIRENVDVIQSVAMLCSKRTRIKNVTNREGNRSDIYTIIVSDTNNVGGDSVEIYRESYNGKVYCAIVPLGRLVVSYNDRTLVCGNTRRGSFAAYLDIDHADVQEFLNIKDIGSPIQNLFFGVNVTHEWMESMIAGDIEKRKTWARVLESRQQKGLPYIFFTDNVNDGRPQIYKDREAVVKSSNLCAEIALPSTAEESFVCCLSSMNLELYDEWKDTDAIFWSVVLLDTVMSEFIEKTEEMPYMEATNKFAKRHRAIGLGVLGYHSLLQKKGLPFGSFEASRLNNKIFKQLKEQSYEASEKLGSILGVAPIFGEGETTDVPRRNSTLNAIAPTTSNSAILGQLSPGIEPSASNYFKVGLAKGNFMRKNKYLQPILAERGFDNDETWRSIMLDNGSVMNLPKEALSDEEKQVFLTFREISPMDIITTASQRQKYIDQAQSINLQIPSTMPVKDVNFLYMEAWKKGIKTLYYQRSSSVSKEMMVKFVSCSGCEG